MLSRPTRLLALTAILVALGCGGEEPAPTPAAATAPAPVAPPPAPALPTSPTFTVTSPVVYRYTDGDWIVRVNVDLMNGTAQPYTTTRAAFATTPSMRPWANASTFPETVVVQAGQRVSGTIAWYTSGANVAPPSVTISNGSWSTTVSPVQTPLPPASTAVVTQVTGAVTAQFTGTATTWRHTDQDHIVRAPVTITNNTNIPLSIGRIYFGADYDGRRGSNWGQASTIPDPLELAPGASTSGFVAWYWDDTLPVPTQITPRLGAPNAPLVTATIAVAPGAAP